MSKNDDLVRRLRKEADNMQFNEELDSIDDGIALMREAADAIERGAAQGEASKSVGSIVPSGCSGTSLAFSEGVLHVAKDGSGYIAIGEDEFTLEDDRCEGPDGPEGSVHWITRFPPGEMEALRDFLNGLHLSTPPAPTPQPPAVEVEAVNPETGMADLSLRGILAATHAEHEAALKAKTDEIERLRRERDIWQGHTEAAIDDFNAAEASNKALRENVEKVIEDMPESYYRTQLAAALRALRGEGGVDRE